MIYSTFVWLLTGKDVTQVVDIFYYISSSSFPLTKCYSSLYIYSLLVISFKRCNSSKQQDNLPKQLIYPSPDDRTKRRTTDSHLLRPEPPPRGHVSHHLPTTSSSRHYETVSRQGPFKLPASHTARLVTATR